MPVCKGSMAKTGAKCEKHALCNGYCGYHKGQATEEVVTRQRCKGTLVKTGDDCTRPAYANGYCGYHKAQADLTHVTPTKQTLAVTPTNQTLAVTPTTPVRNSTRSARVVAPRQPKHNAVSRHGMICATADERTLLVLQELVDVYSTYDKIFIGKASSGNTPEKRWSQKYESLGYERMQVLCETPTVQGALWLENELIAHCKRVDGVNIQNPIAGGGGAKGKPPGYVYLVVG